MYALISPLIPGHKRPDRANATVNSDAYSECFLSRYPRGYYRPSEYKSPEHVDQSLSFPDYKFHFISV